MSAAAGFLPLGLPQVLMLGIPLLAFVSTTTVFPGWVCRKYLHIGTGCIAMLMDVDDFWVRASVYCVAAIVWLTVPFMDTFHFSQKGDYGILSYLFFCALAVFTSTPFWRIAPM